MVNSRSEARSSIPKTPAQCKPSVAGPFLKILEEFLGPGLVLERGMGGKVPLHSLLLETPIIQEVEHRPDSDTRGLGGETWEEVAGSICLGMRGGAQSRNDTGAKAWALELAGFP